MPVSVACASPAQHALWFFQCTLPTVHLPGQCDVSAHWHPPRGTSLPMWARLVGAGLSYQCPALRSGAMWEYSPMSGSARHEPGVRMHLSRGLHWEVLREEVGPLLPQPLPQPCHMPQQKGTAPPASACRDSRVNTARSRWMNACRGPAGMEPPVWTRSGTTSVSASLDIRVCEGREGRMHCSHVRLPC